MSAINSTLRRMKEHKMTEGMAAIITDNQIDFLFFIFLKPCRFNVSWHRGGFGSQTWKFQHLAMGASSKYQSKQ